MSYVRSPYEFTAFESIAADNTNKSLTAATRAGKSFVHITCEDQDVQYRLDAGDSTADGHVLSVGESLDIEAQNNINNFRFTRAGGVNGTLKVSYAVEEAV